jgi:hypothetical protein
MNSPFVIRQAEALAQRVCAAEEDEVRRVERAYKLALARRPSAGERDRAVAFLRAFAKRGSTDTARNPWPAFSQALFASAEFRYLD